MPNKKDLVQFLIPANEKQLKTFLDHQQNKSAVIRAMLFILLANKGEDHDWTTDLQDRRWRLTFDGERLEPMIGNAPVVNEPASSTELPTVQKSVAESVEPSKPEVPPVEPAEEKTLADTDKSSDWREKLAAKHRQLQSE